MMKVWLLILALTLFSVTIIMFVSAHLSILLEMEKYYGVDQTSILHMYNGFNLCYLFVSPFLVGFFDRYYLKILSLAVVIVMLGIIGRYWAETSYFWALVTSLLVSIGHVPFLIAPYSLLKLLPPGHETKSSIFIVFIPMFGGPLVFLYGIVYIQNSPNLHESVQELNFLIALGAIFCTIICLVFLQLNKSQIQTHIVEKLDPGKGECEKFKSIYAQMIGSNRAGLIVLICWGCILGVNWTYGGFFQIVFKDTGLSEREIAYLGIINNIASIVSANIGSFVRNHCKFKTTSIILAFNILGFFCSVMIKAANIFSVIGTNLWLLAITNVLLRVGLSSYVPLAFSQIRESYGMSEVVMTGVFFWVANAGDLFFNVILDQTKIGVTIIMFSLLFFILIGYFVEKNHKKTCESGKKQVDDVSFESLNHMKIQNQLHDS